MTAGLREYIGERADGLHASLARGRHYEDVIALEPVHITALAVKFAHRWLFDVAMFLGLADTTHPVLTPGPGSQSNFWERVQ